MQPCRVQRLVHVDVAQARQHPLVQQKRLEARPPPLQAGLERCQVEGFRQRLRPQRTQDTVRILHQPDPAELARIVEAQLLAAVQGQHHMGMRVGWAAGGRHLQPPAHLEVNDEVARGLQVEDDVLAPPPHRAHTPPRQVPVQRGRVVERQLPRPGHAGALEDPPRKDRRQIAGVGFDLGQLRHRSVHLSGRWHQIRSRVTRSLVLSRLEGGGPGMRVQRQVSAEEHQVTRQA
jgi:hypothetical protein